MEDIKGCYYCDQDKGSRSLLLKICDPGASDMLLCKDQILAGRYIIIFQGRYSELLEIPKAGRDEYMGDACALAWIVKDLSRADKINYTTYGNEVTHVHYTLCPKYKDRPDWGNPFVLFLGEKDKITLTGEQYRGRTGLVHGAVVKRRGARL